MCVKLLKDDQILEYDCERPLTEQVNGVREVLVNYQPNDKEVKSFLSEMQKCAKNGTNPNVKVRVEYNSLIDGYKTKKQFVKAMNDITLNEIIKLIALMQRSIDKSLEEIANTMANR
jgi:hypothetical protein